VEETCENLIVTSKPSDVVKLREAPLESVNPAQSNHHISLRRPPVPRSAYCDIELNVQWNNTIANTKRLIMQIVPGLKG